MYSLFLPLHSLFRWLVLVSLLSSIITAYRGVSRKLNFTPVANSLRHWTATIAHIQLLLGITLYFQSPVVISEGTESTGISLSEHTFFRYLHLSLMITAIVMITIGSAKAKRMPDDLTKYQTMLGWFSTALLIIFIAIPWPFSPLAARPFLRHF